MTLSQCFNVRHLVLAAAVVTGLGLVNHANAASYLIDLNTRTAKPLGTLGGNFTAVGINDLGQVVGSWTAENYVTHAFITGPDGEGMRDLGTLRGNFSTARAINDAGQVVGFSDGHAFITGPDGRGMRELGALGGNWSTAHAINDAGQVVGEFDPAGSYANRAFITGPDGMGMRDLGTLGGNWSRANGINDAGQVVGYSFTADGKTRAFITGPDGMEMRDLGTLVGGNVFQAGGNVSYAMDINDAGQVVGESSTPEVYGQVHAFITGPDGMGMRDLGTLGADPSRASAINDAGQVVGRSWVPDIGYEHAFITGPDGKGMMDLNSLVDLPQGVVLAHATDINNNGQVIALGGVIPIPEPETYALMLAGLGLIGFAARRKKADSVT